MINNMTQFALDHLRAPPLKKGKDSNFKKQRVSSEREKGVCHPDQ